MVAFIFILQIYKRKKKIKISINQLAKLIDTLEKKIYLYFEFLGAFKKSCKPKFATNILFHAFIFGAVERILCAYDIFQLGFINVTFNITLGVIYFSFFFHFKN